MSPETSRAARIACPLVASHGRFSIAAITRSRSTGVSTAKNGALCRRRRARELVEIRKSLTRFCEGE